MSGKFKEVVGVVDNVILLERESFDVLINEHKDLFTLDKAVKFNLKDYGNDKHAFIVKITHKDRSFLVVSDLLSYQSHVPF